MACHRRDDAAASQIQVPPEESHGTGRDGSVPSLQHVTCAERNARDDKAHSWSSKIAFEAREQKRALDLFAHTSPNRRDDSKQHGIERRTEQSSQRVVLDVVERWPNRSSEGHDSRDAEDQRTNQRYAENRFAYWRPRAEEDLSGRLTVRKQQQHRQSNDQHGVDQRQEE